jgi:hypothetical protein
MLVESVCTQNWVIVSDFAFCFFAVYVQPRLIFSCVLFIVITCLLTCAKQFKVTQLKQVVNPHNLELI